jgi:hypothetical protein
MPNRKTRDHIEQELKLALAGEDDYLRARDLLEPSERVVKAAGMMLRVRQEGGDVVATLKSGARLEGGTLRAREQEAAVDPDEWTAIVSGRAAVGGLRVEPVRAVLLAVGGDADLRIRGTMRNRRSVHRVAGFTVELDRTELPDGSVSFEIEVETEHPDEAREALVERLEQGGVRWSEQTLTKYERFLRALEGQGERPSQ